MRHDMGVEQQAMRDCWIEESGPSVKPLDSCLGDKGRWGGRGTEEIKGILAGRGPLRNKALEPQTTIYKWLFQLDDFKSLHWKWLFH